MCRIMKILYLKNLDFKKAEEYIGWLDVKTETTIVNKMCSIFGPVYLRS